MTNRSAARLILLHGLASTPAEFALLVHPLRRLGIPLVTPEIEGYTHGSVRDGVSWDDWVRAATARIAQEIAASPGPFVLGGLCSGALLAAAVAARGKFQRLRGIALLSPLVAYDGWGLPWWYRLRVLAYALALERRFAMQERPPYGLKNERMRQIVRQQMLTQQASLAGPSQVSLAVVRESERLSRHAVRALETIHCPVLALHARRDEICRLASVQTVLRRLPPERVRLIVLEDSYHLITADNDRHALARDLAQFASTLCDVPQSRKEFAPSGTLRV